MGVKSFGRIWVRKVVSGLLLDVLKAQVEKFVQTSTSHGGKVIAVLLVVEVKHRVAPPNVLPESGIESKNLVFLRTSDFERNVSGVDPSIERTTSLDLFQKVFLFRKLSLQIFDLVVTDSKECIFVQFEQEFTRFCFFLRIH